MEWVRKPDFRKQHPDLSKEEIDNELAKYVDFESIKYNEFLREKKKLSIIEYSAYGKECTTNLEIH